MTGTRRASRLQLPRSHSRRSVGAGRRLAHPPRRGLAEPWRSGIERWNVTPRAGGRLDPLPSHRRRPGLGMVPRAASAEYDSRVPGGHRAGHLSILVATALRRFIANADNDPWLTVVGPYAGAVLFGLAVAVRSGFNESLRVRSKACTRSSCAVSSVLSSGVRYTTRPSPFFVRTSAPIFLAQSCAVVSRILSAGGM